MGWGVAGGSSRVILKWGRGDAILCPPNFVAELVQNESFLISHFCRGRFSASYLQIIF